MPDRVEVAIEKALVSRAQAFAAAQSPQVAISLPNIEFTPPSPVSQTSRYLRATFLPVPSNATLIPFNSHVTHSGLLQIDVFWGLNAGEYTPGRMASDLIAYFPRGSRLVQDGFTVRIDRAPYRGPMIKDDPWMMIPVSIPYQCFARP